MEEKKKKKRVFKLKNIRKYEFICLQKISHYAEKKIFCCFFNIYIKQKLEN